MGSIFWKRFQLCCNKLKCFSTNFSTSSSSQQDHEYHRQYPSASTLISTTTDDFFSSSDAAADDSDSPPDLATVFASQRFFFSSPGHSNSILQSPETLQPFFDYPPLAGCVAVHTETPDPYRDFRQSMLEMVEARRLTDVTAKLRYLHELLLCYLTLNPKSSHKFIASAFSDLVMSLMSADGRRRSDVRRRLLM